MVHTTSAVGTSASLAAFRADVLDGLRRPQKEFPCKYLYDERGSELFERITELDEYYLTRTERAIMEEYAPEMAAALGPGCLVIEYGSGSSRKTRLLLDHLEEPAGYIPLDISAEPLLRAATKLRRAYPKLRVEPVVADFTADYTLPAFNRPVRRRVVYFPGSTIGNFQPNDARRFLAHTWDVVGPDGAVLLGVDLQKPRVIVELAYNDAAGVTPTFNLNLLRRINRELDANFDLDAFEHEAPYNPAQGRIEMYLVSLRDQQVQIGDVQVHFRKGERILTEHSYKYRQDDFEQLVGSAGLAVERRWTDQQQLFSIQLLVPSSQGPEHPDSSTRLPS